MTPARVRYEAEVFECARCGGVFPKGRSDEEAEAEMNELFGDEMTTDECDVICDDCFKIITR